MRLQLSEYEKQYWQKKSQILALSFPKLHEAIGSNDWERLIPKYLQRHPCESFQIYELGYDLADFLRKRHPWCESPHLAELARFEWTCILVAHKTNKHKLEIANQTVNQLFESISPIVSLRCGTQLFSSFYSFKLTRHKLSRGRSLNYYALDHYNNKLRMTKLKEIEFRILNWIAQGLLIDALALRARRLGYTENQFFKILFSLQRNQLLHYELNAN